MFTFVGFQNCQKPADAKKDETVTSAGGMIKCTPNNCVCNGGITYGGCGGSTITCNGDSIVCPSSKASALLIQHCETGDLNCADSAETVASEPVAQEFF